MSTVVPPEVLQWTFECKSGNLKSQNQYSTAGVGNGYSMYNQSINQFLTYKETNFGINLGYKTARECKTHFRLPDGSEREILTGEKVALGIGGGKAFLCYQHRAVGINLAWTQAPCFQWRIFDATGEPGKKIPTGSLVAIINENVEPQADFLVYHDREAGADVGWTTSPTLWDHAVELAKAIIVSGA